MHVHNHNSLQEKDLVQKTSNGCVLIWFGHLTLTSHLSGYIYISIYPSIQLR
jgi:hypothetical protein